jgi:hypothetical protein
MTPEQTKALRDHFMTWSGGFGLESGNEISFYIESSLGVDMVPNEALDEILRWLEETDADESAAARDCLNG